MLKYRSWKPCHEEYSVSDTADACRRMFGETSRGSPLEDSAGKGDNEIYIVSHGWHTGFVVPADDVQRRLPELKQRFGNTAYIEFGWGDEGFYQAEEVTSGLTLKAIFWPSESVMHAVAVPVAADKYFSGHEMVRLCLTDGELRSLVDFIEGSFYKDERGEIRRLGDGIYGDSQFYKGWVNII
ncbi:DUF2459 domain-containing protein [Azotobacter sp. CWF10]